MLSANAILAAIVMLEHWVLGGIAAAVVLEIALLVVIRPPAVPRMTLALAGAGALLLALAAGGLAGLRPTGQPVAVLVDLSPSTRGAEYRDVAALQRRVRELLGDTPRELHVFAEQIGSADLASQSLPDLHALRTRLPQIDAPAVLLFSDGRLTAPDLVPPIYCVIDPLLENVEDAAVTSLDARGDTVAVGARNTHTMPRVLALAGVARERQTAIRPGAFILTENVAAESNAISATFAPGDLWPENDSLRTLAPPPAIAERWWIGAEPPDDSWRSFAPEQMPADPGLFLGASVIVLNNVPADSLDEARRSALLRYVRDLGGGVLILGGTRAFAAGEYAGTALDTISPLASAPPEPTTHWLLLADASGSMNQPAGGAGRTRWDYAAEAVVNVAKQLPPADLLSIGSFADELRWWSQGRSAAETIALSLPPPNLHPRGRTNLEAALREVANSVDASLPKELLIATDAQASISNAADLAERLKARKVRVHLLLLGREDKATGLLALTRIVQTTGGTLRTERLPEKWAAGLRELLRAAQPAGVQREPITATFQSDLASFAPVKTSIWNRTWPKPQITPLAESTFANDRIIMAARWNLGAGRVAAVAFSPPRDQADALARLVERPPRDPRFRVTWDTGSTLRVSVDAVEDQGYLNGERLALEMTGADSSWTTQAVPQIAPGRYELAIDSPARAAYARIRRGEQILDTISLPARYPAEFDAVGNDRPALADLAGRSGGAVIEPNVVRPLDLSRPRRRVPLGSWLTTAGAALIAAGLVRWRIGS